MDETKLAQWREELLKERQRLQGELSSFATKDPKMKDNWNAGFPERDGGDKPASRTSPDEQADMYEEFETELAQEHSLENRLAEVNHALERVETGGYGICKECGEPIPEERLRANPAAEYDIAHQPREE